MPLKFTWKSIAGLLSLVAGYVLPYVTTGVSHWQGALGSLGGLLVLGFERLADSKDFATTGGVNVGALSAAVADARSEVATVKAQAAADLSSARSSVIAELGRLAQAAQPAAAPVAPAPAPPAPEIPHV
jgi:hypothetical protein